MQESAHNTTNESTLARNKYGTSLRSTYLLNKTQPDVGSTPTDPHSPPLTVPKTAGTRSATRRKPRCMDWTRWLVAETVSHMCVVICGTVLFLHQCLCGGLAISLLVLIPILGWSSDGSINAFGFSFNSPNSLTWADHVDTLTIAGAYLLVGAFIDLIAMLASMKMAHRAIRGYLTMILASIAQIGRLVYLLVMIRNGKDLWDKKSALMARTLFVVELVVLMAIIGIYLFARWRHNERKTLSRQELPTSHVEYA